MIKVLKLSFVVLFIILLNGCVHKNPVPKKEYNKDITIGITSNLGDTFEYYFANMLYREHKYTSIDKWKIDEFIENKLKEYLLKKGFHNIRIINPTEEIVLLKNQRKSFVYPEHKKVLYKLREKNNCDILIYIENIVNLGRMVIGKHSISSKNVSVNNTKFLNNNYANTLLAIVLYEKDNYKYAYRIEEKLIEKNFFDKNKSIYEKDNLEKIKPIIFSMIDESVKKYVDEFVIK